MFDILLKGGVVIDPSQNINQKASVAIDNGRVVAVGADIVEDDADRIYEVKDLIVCPGLIDAHCHPAHGFAESGVPETEIGINSGVTFLGDAGTAGAANFEAFRLLVTDHAQTGIVCFLNLAYAGLIKLPEIRSEHDIDINLSAQVINENQDLIKGVKLRAIQSVAEGVGIRSVEMAKKLAAGFNLPLMLHIGESRPRLPKDKMDDFSRSAVSLLDKGDIISHYMTWEPGGLILKNGTVYPELEAARKRGVILDCCHGLNHFSFTIAKMAISQGFPPDIISTDLCKVVRPSAQSLTVVMSKLLALGLGLDEVIAMTTINPAKALGIEDMAGSIKPGMPADITIMNLTKGDFIFNDGNGKETLNSDKLLTPQMVIKNGKIMPAHSLYHLPRGFR